MRASTRKIIPCDSFHFYLVYSTHIHQKQKPICTGLSMDPATSTISIASTFSAVATWRGRARLAVVTWTLHVVG